MIRLIAFLAFISAVNGASDLVRCNCQGSSVYGFEEQAFQVTGYEWDNDYAVCEKVCSVAKYTVLTERRASRNKRQAGDGGSLNPAFSLGPCSTNPCDVPAAAPRAPAPAPEVPGYRHAINYNCVEQCAAPQFRAPLCHFECSRHGQFLDTISVAAPPRAIVTSPVIPPPPPPRSVAIPVPVAISATGPQYGVPFGGSPYGAQQYGAPQYGVPFGGPQFGVPYGAPQFGAPNGAQQYGAPYGAQQYGAPQYEGPYGAPQYGTPYSGQSQNPLAAFPIPAQPALSVAVAQPGPIVAAGPPPGYGSQYGGAGPLNGPLFSQLGFAGTADIFPGAYTGNFAGAYGYGYSKKK